MKAMYPNFTFVGICCLVLRILVVSCCFIVVGVPELPKSLHCPTTKMTLRTWYLRKFRSLEARKIICSCKHSL